MDRFGVGVIGCGIMGRSLAHSAQALEHVTVLRVSDLDERRAKKLAEEVDAEFNLDYRDMLADGRIQGVFIASPPFMHRRMAVDAANAGKHVFSEKPMAPTLEDCDAMMQAAQRNGVKLTIGLVCRFHATHSKVREIVHSGKMGKPVCMVMHRIGGTWNSQDYATHWRLQRNKSGGSLMEINTHEIDFMRWTCGEVSTVYAIGGRYVQQEADYPDVVLASLTFENGSVGLLHSSHVSAIDGYGGRVDCERGSIYFPEIWGKGASVRVKNFEDEEIRTPISEIEVEEPVRHEIRAFVDAVLNDTTPPITGADGRAAVEIALAAYQSVETGKPVSVSSSEQSAN